VNGQTRLRGQFPLDDHYVFTPEHLASNLLADSFFFDRVPILDLHGLVSGQDVIDSGIEDFEKD
jgi:hypothetical protein